MGIVQDRCGCCDVCGLEQGHRCNTRRELTDIALSKRTFGSYGQCGENLECQERSDVSHEVMGTENVCVCVKPGRFCASNGETYSACQMDAVSITSKGKITIVSYDDCKSEPQIVDFSRSQEIPDGNSTTFWCEVKGYPLPIVTWYFMAPGRGNDAILLPGDSDEMSVSLRGAPPGRKIISHLQIREFNIKHEGVYQCFVENDFGSDRRNISAIYLSSPNKRKSRISDEV